MDRYAELFARKDGVFVPFFMLGDPSYEESKRIINQAIAAGADALELGISFSDPVADGPTIQRAHIRAADTTPTKALELVGEIRAEHPTVPIGLLVYGNVAFSMGFGEFYEALKIAGADSVLIPDVPVRESEPFRAAAKKHGIKQVFIAPPHASQETLAMVAEHSEGYIYAVSRDGVTGTEREATFEAVPQSDTPVLLGFGISTPEHVKAARHAGADGVIVGSALVKLIEAGQQDQISHHIAEFKSAL
ncbi:Tryptophan synthase alpha chain [Corynebacterium kalinowskii]|uniref:Tryptophan synthase alpha chain n=1 Tax=Corynebacterium kalinowskii TaxID=2675216 RepID=A0A6B8VTH9_9CORY|nr:tryptophan synthase subunit alpha [Corynebacterium kalinowskii]QGU03271.1 Tryptophan synthase alpha chain [Corynebacterium kalinowskii]